MAIIRMVWLVGPFTLRTPEPLGRKVVAIANGITIILDPLVPGRINFSILRYRTPSKTVCRAFTCRPTLELELGWLRKFKSFLCRLELYRPTRQRHQSSLPHSQQSLQVREQKRRRRYYRGDQGGRRSSTQEYYCSRQRMSRNLIEHALR